MSRILQRRQDDEQKKLLQQGDIITSTESTYSAPTISPVTSSSRRLGRTLQEGTAFNNSVKSYEAIKRNPAVFEAAKRFLADRHGMTKVKDEDVIDEFISHFRSFDVNEMTTAGDYGYVSAAASDATTIAT